MFGYQLHEYENLVPYMMNYKNELYINGLYLCGGFTGDAFGYRSDIESGYLTAKIAIKRMDDNNGK